MKERDYKNFDHVNLTVKKENVEEVSQAYSEFLWQEVYRREDRRFNDVLNLCFKREHKVKNKDKLQLYQVHYESLINERAGLIENKHNKAGAMISNVAILGALALFLGIMLLVFGKSLPYLICGGVLLFITAILLPFFIVKCRNLFRKENRVFEQNFNENKKKITELLSKVKLLTEVENEQ